MSVEFPFTRKDILERIHAALPRVARMGGNAIIRELIEDIRGAQEIDDTEYDLLLIYIGLLAELSRRHTDTRMEWMRLRRDVMTSQDENKARELTLGYWHLHSNRRLGLRDRRLVAKHPPDIDACREMYIRVSHRLEQKIEYVLALIAHTPELGNLSDESAESFEQLTWDIGRRPGRWPMRAAAFNALTEAFRRGLPKKLQFMRELMQLCNNDSVFPWVRLAALRCLVQLDFSNAYRITDNLFRRPPETGDSFITRRIFLKEIKSWGRTGMNLIRQAALRDASNAVRQQAAAFSLEHSDRLPSRYYDTIARDPAPEVRGAWLLMLSYDLPETTRINILEQAGAHMVLEKDENLVLQSLQTLYTYLVEYPPALINPAMELTFMLFADRLRSYAMKRTLPLRLHSWWWLIITLLEIMQEENLRTVLAALRTTIADIPEGTTKLLPSQVLPPGEGDRDRILTTIASVDFGLFAQPDKKGLRVTRGQPRARKLWRFIHEIRNPSYDKRQAHSHMTGLDNRGSLWFPSLIMAEVTRTRIPGEKVYVPSFGHYAPHIPGPTEASNLKLRPMVQIVLPGARLTIERGGPVLRRLRENLRTDWRYGKLDDIRFNALRDGTAPALKNYVSTYQAMTGQRIRITSPDKRWETLMGMLDVTDLPAAGFISGLMEANDQLSYFITPMANELWHLSVFLLAMGGFLFGRAWMRNRQVINMRKAIPLSVGGWGSRGKSGTERLKAALFHGLGYQVFSKTTGTLAMFISSIPGIDPVEIPLYRPYDKATIFEQVDVLRQASEMDAQVFLWECMALNPRYVQILSHDWMRDDVATITNTYPDHEDIQGPTGYDVSNTISRFLPMKARAVSCEMQMQPVLRETARRNATAFSQVPMALPFLLPDDYMERFPYLEHPLNIALMLTMGDELDIDRDLAMVVMADHLVADVGALKQYPQITVHNRQAAFSNTMSANERAGFLASYQRLGFHNWDSRDNMKERMMLVVNNRADRPARSHVFAKVIVEDTATNGVVVIGTAVTEFGMMLQHYLEQYLERNRTPVAGDPESQRQWLRTVFHPVRRNPATAGEWVETLRRWFDVPPEDIETAFDPVMKHLEADIAAHKGAWSKSAVQGVWGHRRQDIARAMRALVPSWFEKEPEDDLVNACGYELTAGALVAHFARICTTPDAGAGISTQVASAMTTLFNMQRHLVEIPDAPGEVTMDVCAANIPAFTAANLVGCQNIKGAGMNFVNLWIAVEAVHQKLELWRHGDEYQQRQGFEWLLGRKGYHLHDARMVLDELDARSGGDQKNLNMEERSLYQRLQETQGASAGAENDSGGFMRRLTDRMVAGIDDLIDFRDSIGRRKGADKIMRLLSLGLISHEEAARRMLDIYGRQKYGRFTWALQKRRG